MFILLPLLLAAIAGAMLGLCVGCLARGREEVVVEVERVVEKVVTKTVERIVERESDETAKHREQTNEILTQLQQLTTGVSENIHAHSHSVGAINDELTHAGQGEAIAVVTAIRRLVESNNAMQSQLEVAQAQLKEQANLLELRQAEARTDPLTKLPNRRAFDDELARRTAECMAGGASLSLMILDIDHFKKCNDSYGHLAGDEVLRRLGKVLAEAHEQKGLFAARYGGEEFVALFSAQSLDAAANLGDQLRRRLQQSPVDFEGNAITVTASSGVAAWQLGDTKLSIIARADEALYAAKKSGRNCLCVHEEGKTRLLSKVPTAGAPHTVVGLSASDLDSAGTMIKSINRRIAEWRRGGVVLSLIVGRIDNLSVFEAKSIRERDRVLLRTGEYLKTIMREMDQMALMPGEILGMLLPTARLAEAVQIAERMCGGLDRGDLDKPLGTHVTISFGAAEVTADDDGDLLILRARRALEAARRRGGNAVYVNDGVYSTPAHELLGVVVAAK